VRISVDHRFAQLRGRLVGGWWSVVGLKPDLHYLLM
jgi:hypothetical protein